MYEISVIKKYDVVLEHWEKRHYGRYQKKCLPMEAYEETTLKDLIRRLGSTEVKDLITQYFLMNGKNPADTFFVDNGHTVGIFKSSLHSLNAALGTRQKSDDTGTDIWVVGYSESGHPLEWPRNERKVKWVEPMHVDEWLSLDHSQRFERCGCTVNDKELWAKSFESFEAKMRERKGAQDERPAT